MNIIKLKDVVIPEGYGMSKFFNETLKGKYAYWIKMRYIFPMDSMNYKTYIKYEQLDSEDFLNEDILPHIDLYSEDCCIFEFAQNYIDHESTELANSINEYITANEYVADFDIDINKLRNFRTWLATELLSFNTDREGNYLNDLSIEQIHMLEYYKNGMYNDVVKHLSIFGVENAFNVSSNTGCSCCNSTSIDLSNISTCNALDIYIKNLHNLMVKSFENVNFWLKYNKDFIRVFKKYIDNIIKTRLVIENKTNTYNLYTRCNCNNNANSTQIILKNLSDALHYIINDDVTGHANFISDALHDWADKLYDNMNWNIK